MKDYSIKYYNMAGEQISREEALPLFGKEGDKRIVAQETRDDVLVSTVLLVMSHTFDDGPPLIFETMIFGGPHNEQQWRYSTRRQAEEGHREACKLAFESEEIISD